MADYRELLRRAVAALPENNGAARRAVYEKARSALVGQLRAIDPPLPAREITQHRLQLEDCIREVEQEASEAVISLGRDEAARATPVAPPPPPEVAPPAASLAPAPVEPQAATKAEPVKAPVTEPDPEAKPEPEPEAAAESEPVHQETIEDIIAEAEASSADTPEGEKAEDTKPETAGTLLPDDGDEVPAAAEPAKPEESAPQAKQGFRLFPSLASRNESPVAPATQRPSSAEPRGGQVRLAASKSGEAFATGRVEPTLGNQAVARKREPEPDQETMAVIEDQPVEAALSSVREVEVEPSPEGANDTREAEGAIERAIQTLDREARGETVEEQAEQKAESSDAKAGGADADKGSAEDADFVQTVSEPRGGSGLTIFLIVFALLLAGVGGAGFWAWREGYIDLEQMFGSSSAAVASAETSAPDTPEDIPTLDPEPAQTPAEPQTGPGNTTTETAVAEPTTALQGIEGEERLTPEPESPEPTDTPDEAIVDDRLPADTDTALVDDPAASVDPAVLAGSQSLLLEAADDGETGAVPFSGTVEWSEGVDELGLPTLVANADIPARNLSIEIIIRRNSDPSLPASHLMEINFDVPDTFVGGSISSLPGVLLKNEELVQGTPLVGASARVVGNSFLFALSAAEDDLATNRELLSERKWMDLAVIYATGKRAIITLEKDDAAEELFTEVFAEWQQAETAESSDG